jgi:hypothetical protein
MDEIPNLDSLGETSKDLHLIVDKEIFFRARSKLLVSRVSVNHIISYFVEKIAEGDLRAEQMIRECVIAKLKKKTTKKYSKKKDTVYFKNIDKDTLYNLISDISTINNSEEKVEK